MPAAPAGTPTTTVEVVNVAVDADKTAAHDEYNDAMIFDREDVSFDQWMQFQSWQDHKEDGDQFITIYSE